MHSRTAAGPLSRPLLAASVAGALTAAGLVTVGLPSAAAATSNIAQGKTTWATSSESANLTPSKAVDGDTSTRWASERSDAQAITVDLGSSAVVEEVVLQWEAAYAEDFEVQLSDSAESGYRTVTTVTDGTGGTQTLPAVATARYLRLKLDQRGTGYGYSLLELQVLGSGGSTPAPYTPKPLPPAPPGADTSVTHHEFQANCVPTHTAADDPIVFPGQPGRSHDHTFMGNLTTDADSTTASLLAGGTSCTVPQDRSAYWFPTLSDGGDEVVSPRLQTVYYKSGITDYKDVRPFPQGLRYVVGSPMATQDEFRTSPGTVEGFECGSSSFNWDIPASCAPGSELNVRYQAPSCWNGTDLDSADHKSHMAYPVQDECPPSHPVAVPMIEFKLSWPVSGDLREVSFASGRGYSFHYDFINAWDEPVLQGLVEHCINGGLQCSPRGFDQYKQWAGGVLDEDFRLIS